MGAAVILRALIRRAAVWECTYSLLFSLLLQLSSHHHLSSRLLPTPRINHNERLEFLGDAVVEFLTRWESAHASLIDTTANWSWLLHYQPFFFSSRSFPHPLTSFLPLPHCLHLSMSVTTTLLSILSTHLRQWCTGNWNWDVIPPPLPPF